MCFLLRKGEKPSKSNVSTIPKEIDGKGPIPLGASIALKKQLDSPHTPTPRSKFDRDTKVLPTPLDPTICNIDRTRYTHRTDTYLSLQRISPIPIFECNYMNVPDIVKIPKLPSSNLLRSGAREIIGVLP